MLGIGKFLSRTNAGFPQLWKGARILAVVGRITRLGVGRRQPSRNWLVADNPKDPANIQIIQVSPSYFYLCLFPISTSTDVRSKYSRNMLANSANATTIEKSARLIHGGFKRRPPKIWIASTFWIRIRPRVIPPGNADATTIEYLSYTEERSEPLFSAIVDRGSCHSLQM
uniref:Uncharacterized protein n=1 Tax=Coccidioides posadasii RMSCC 3488 TaxID=454284 RepID=A0A0J6FJ19_COCPO|nr:hypothetical protein CPAG_09450 [Coccidioides posadasii RMSCC 3488]